MADNKSSLYYDVFLTK